MESALEFGRQMFVLSVRTLAPAPAPEVELGDEAGAHRRIGGWLPGRHSRQVTSKPDWQRSVQKARHVSSASSNSFGHMPPLEDVPSEWLVLC